jgi:hypothetical protein
VPVGQCGLGERQDDAPLDEFFLAFHALELLPHAGADPAAAEFLQEAEFGRARGEHAFEVGDVGPHGETVLGEELLFHLGLGEDGRGLPNIPSQQFPVDGLEQRGADASAAPRGVDCQAQDPRPVAAHAGDDGAHHLIAHHRDERGLGGEHGGDDLGDAEDGGGSVGGGFLPEVHRLVEIAVLEIAYLPDRPHRASFIVTVILTVMSTVGSRLRRARRGRQPGRKRTVSVALAR